MGEFPAHAVDFRGKKACTCQETWIPVYEAHLRWAGILRPEEDLEIFQLIGSVKASAKTHCDREKTPGQPIGGGAADFDLTGERAREAVAIARQMGADASWHRLKDQAGKDSPEHIHSVLRDCPHLTDEAMAQIGAVDGNGDGLVGAVKDDGPRPLSKRTWKEGIEWAREREDDMPRYSEWDPKDKKALAQDVADAVARELFKRPVDNKKSMTFKGAVELAGRFAKRQMDRPQPE